MAGFSLSGGGGRGGGGEGNHHNQEIPPEHLFLLKNQEISSSYNKSLELWQQQQQEQHHHHHQEIYPITMGMGVGPSSMRHQGGGSGSGGGGGSSSGGGGGISCQDCGNQAKKDCSYMRCRTCCKSRDFDCSTHVKSTWVPASRRRERQQQIQQHLHVQPPAGQQDLRSENPKRPREDKNTTTSTVAVVAPLHPPTTSAPAGLQMANFPAEVSSPAMFRCVKVVSAMDEGEDQYAYQTAVSIGGHLFKGILYDQGPDNPYGSGGGEGGRITGSTSNTNVISTSAMMDPSSMYPAPLNAFLADLICKRKKWLPTLRNLVSHINDTFSRTFQEMAVRKVSLGEQYSFRFEVPIISLEGNDQFQPFSIWCLCKTLLTACPFRVVDEINQGMDPINERNMFQQLMRAVSQLNMLHVLPPPRVKTCFRSAIIKKF